jgi:hypothetical protein
LEIPHKKATTLNRRIHVGKFVGYAIAMDFIAKMNAFASVTWRKMKVRKHSTESFDAKLNDFFRIQISSVLLT